MRNVYDVVNYKTLPEGIKNVSITSRMYMYVHTHTYTHTHTHTNTMLYTYIHTHTLEDGN